MRAKHNSPWRRRRNDRRTSVRCALPRRTENREPCLDQAEWFDRRRNRMAPDPTEEEIQRACWFCAVRNHIAERKIIDRKHFDHLTKHTTCRSTFESFAIIHTSNESTCSNHGEINHMCILNMIRRYNHRLAIKHQDRSNQPFKLQITIFQAINQSI